MADPDLDPRTLAQVPELAALSILDELLDVAVRVLLAEHPILSNNFYCYPEPPTLREARNVLRRIYPLRDALGRYRQAALDAIEPVATVSDDELPF